MPATRPSLLLLHGTDEFAILEHLKGVQARLDPASMDMNLARLDGHTVDQQTLNTAINAIPFLSPFRLVILSSPTAFDKTKLSALLEKLPPTTLLTLVENEALRPDHWLVKMVPKLGGDVRLYAMPKRWEMPRWIESEARKQGGRLEPGAATLLAEMTGEDTRIAALEVAKLLTYVNFERPVTEKDVEKVSAVSAQSVIFELVDALGSGDGKKAQKVLHRLLDEQDAMEFWGMILRQFRLLLQTREVLDEGGTNATVQKELGLQEFVAGKIIPQAKRFSLESLEAIYHRLLEIDTGFKSGQMPLDVALDSFVMELTRTR